MHQVSGRVVEVNVVVPNVVCVMVEVNGVSRSKEIGRLNEFSEVESAPWQSIRACFQEPEDCRRVDSART